MDLAPLPPLEPWDRFADLFRALTAPPCPQRLERDLAALGPLARDALAMMGEAP